MQLDEPQRVISDERQGAGEHPEEDHAERIDVARRHGRLSRGLFRRNVGGGTEQRSCLGQRARAESAAGEAEVPELWPVLFVEEDVRRLEVAVDDASRVKVCKPGSKSARDSRSLGGRERPGGEPVFESPAW